MDVATRFQPRVRAQSYLDRERDALPDDSGGESESLPRRKFQRTATDSDSTNPFRKPSIPASAMRPAGLEPRPSLSQRRRSTLRENVRVPSGPREFPSPGKRLGSTASTTAPPVHESTNTRSFLPHTTSEPLFASHTNSSNYAANQSSFSFGNGNQHSSTDGTDSPTTPAERAPDAFDFVPTMNFDDFQNSIVDPNWTSPLLSEFPAVSGGRALPKRPEEGGAMARSNGFASTRPGMLKQEESGEERAGMGRTASFRRRLSTAPTARATSGQTAAPVGQMPTSTSQPSLATRTRRQSTMPQASTAPTQPAISTSSRQPRKSVGPGLITTMMDNRKGSSQQAPSTPVDPNLKSSLARTSSLSKARRTTIQPSASAGAELPRLSTLTATTQSRANKVKSLQPPPRAEPDTPNDRPVSKSGQNREHTPSSSGNRRQSTVSGRASGLGARTVSPTDARRLKRMSMAAPPMPTSLPLGPPTPQDDVPNPFARPELPRLTQPSPSLIPRKTSSATPTSARASPEGRHFFGGGVSLSTKSSYQSLVSNSNSNSTSRLPTPKPRSVHSSSAQYGESSELVPPVPAIPKAYESPKEQPDQPFFSSFKPNHSGYGVDADPANADLDFHHPVLPSKTSMDVPSETPGKRSGEHTRHHKWTNNNASTTGAATTGPKSNTGRSGHADQTGRKNNNLQPLRLPPLNLMPINSPTTNKIAGLPRPSQEVDSRDDYMRIQTPEPKRTAKTPSTPMTASKATFFRRQDEATKALRSSSSHYALRNIMGTMHFDDNTTRFFDDSDVEPSTSTGMPIMNAKQRSAITPFASGSLPKSSGEFARLRGRPSGDYQDDYDLGSYAENLQLQSAKPQGPRPKTSGTAVSQTMKSAGPLSSTASPIVEQPPQLPEPKKESSSGGLRRKLSLGWRRTSSKAANHPENKSSPQQPSESLEKVEKERSKLQKRNSEMPPPKLPASATWSGDVPTLPSSARPSLDSARRKSTFAGMQFNGIAPTSDGVEQPAAGGIKTRALHSEQPQPVAASRASSWGNFSNRPASIGKPSVVAARHKLTASTLSAIVKDKDDLAADEEMRRLSQKRRDVDTAARETEALKARAVPRSPVSPERVLHDRHSALNIFERGEIMDYEKDGIYFTGTKNAKKIIGSLTSSPVPSDSKDSSKAGNYGYDDERGDYNIVMGDHLAYRYEVIDLLGKGSFGQVVRCVDHKEGGVVAVKIIRNKKRFHQQALVEVGILGRLRDWDPDGAHATLSITSSFYFRSHLCIVTPCLSINLYEFIRAHNFNGFSLPLIRRFSRQLLASLVLLQTKHIIHCDLKPENILLCEARKADVRVIDFGSSCREEEKVYTYIQSRFYRSPEVILGSSYGLGIDMWSLGCILAELWTGYPLFPGENEQEQLACIMEIFGPPDRHLVERCTRKKLFFDSVGKPRVTVSSKGRRRRPSSKTLAQALKTEDEAFIDFIARCLRWDPERRLKPAEAVAHPFITNLPFNQRAGIPEEARRAARVRSSAAMPAGTTIGSQGIPSPVKRNGVVKEGNAFAQQAATTTPAKERNKALPETPQTALRTGVPATASALAQQGSPSKPAANRRHSTVINTGAAGVAGSKRASNGAVLSATAGSIGGQRLGSGAPTAANLAQMAARESMSATASAQNSSRWRA